MTTRALLADLRKGRVPDGPALTAFACGLADGRVSDAQAGAFAMAVCMGPGLGDGGRAALTTAMADSGKRMVWDVAGPVVDKHSTGGVGDPVSLILAPALAACGCFVPMISGRGLGHTGGTLDKLEAISGLCVDLDRDRLGRVLDDAGCAIIAASGDIAPADKRLYAVRDVTATVDQIDLICASILSKKLAAGLGALVLDVKCGSGAFMRDGDAARHLARVLVDTATGAGLPCRALITDMDQPLADAMGNATEIRAVLRVLRGDGESTRLAQVCTALGGALLHLARVCDTVEIGTRRIAEAIRSGAALERFGKMIAGQGGPADFSEQWNDHLPVAPVIRDILAPQGGILTSMDGTALGHAIVALGGGRGSEADRIDPAVGLSHIAALGTRLAKGDPIARLHAADDGTADAATASILAATHVTDAAPADTPLVSEHLT